LPRTVCAPFRLSCSADHRALLSFPTRRSSDLKIAFFFLFAALRAALIHCSLGSPCGAAPAGAFRGQPPAGRLLGRDELSAKPTRSEEHTSELQSRFDLVCRLLLENIKRIRVLL